MLTAPRRALLAAIRSQAQRSGGSISVAARNLKSGEEVLLAPHSSFPAASVIKVSILAALYAARDEGWLDLNEPLDVPKESIVGGSGVLKGMHAGLQVTLQDLAHLMIVVSDNTATNLIIDRIGFPHIESFLLANAFSQTKVQRKLYDMVARERGIDNLISAWDAIRVFESLYRAALPPLSKESCRECLGILRRQQHDDRIPALLPAGVKIANKPGELDDVQHDAALIQPSGGPDYVLAVMSAGCDGKIKARQAIANISKRVYDYFTLHQEAS